MFPEFPKPFIWMRQGKQICDISGLEISRSRRRVLDGPTECYRLSQFSSRVFLIPACSLVRDFLFWLILTGSRHQVCFCLPTCSDYWQELNWLQTSESNWLETTSVGRNFYCFQTALFVHRYYQKNRSNHHKAVFLLQININKYKTKLFQLEQTGHGWHNF